MSKINYEDLIENAMRDIVKNAIIKASKSKRKDFCFLVAINTKYKALHVPQFMKSLYPAEMDIVLTVKNTHLTILKTGFKTNLQFCGKVYDIMIPFNSILLFIDKNAEVEIAFKGQDIDTNNEYDEIPLLNNDFVSHKKCYTNNLIKFDDLVNNRRKRNV